MVKKHKTVSRKSVKKIKSKNLNSLFLLIGLALLVVIPYLIIRSIFAQTTTDTTPPVITITNLPSGSLVQRNGQATLVASYSDESAIWLGTDGKTLEFYANGKLACKTVAYYDELGGYSCLWAVPAKQGQQYSIYAQAYDSAGNLGKSAPVTVTAADIILITSTPTSTPYPNITNADTTPPVITVISPSNGAVVQSSSNINLIATYSDSSPILINSTKSVKFYANGKLICSTAAYYDQLGGYSCLWQVPAKGGVTYRINAQAYDINNNLGISSEITITSAR